MNHWEYADGKWTQLPDDPFPLDGDLKDALEAAGYSSGDDYALLAMVYEASEENEVTQQWRFVVDLCPAGHICYLVFVKALPDLLNLIPIVNGIRIQYSLEEVAGWIKDFCQKTFHASHSHALHLCCNECDPIGFRQWQERRAAREKDKAKSE